jgi:UDP-N-acetylglucosamine acyltransferase
LAGHVVIEDKVVIGGLAAIHQFVRVGTLSIIGGCSKVIKDVPPYSTCDGHPARIFGLNLVGLKRNNIPKESMQQLNHVFKILFNSGFSIKHAVARLKENKDLQAESAYLINFIENSQRGVSRSCRE